MKKLKRRNPVAQHAHKGNRSQLHRDRKKDQKRGYSRCKTSQMWRDSKVA